MKLSIHIEVEMYKDLLRSRNAGTAACILHIFSELEFKVSKNSNITGYFYYV